MKPGSDAIVRALMERHGGPVFVLDDALRYVDFNSAHVQAMQALYRVTPEVGLSLPSLISDPSAQQQAKGNLERALAGETVIEQTPHSEDVDTLICYRVSHIPIREQQRVVGVLVTAEDISEDLRTKIRLLRSQKSLDEALEASEIASWSFVLPSGEATFSHRYFTMLGYSPEAFPSRFESWTKLLHPQDRVTVVTSVNEMVENSIASFRLEFRLKTAAGGWKWVLGQGKVVERTAQGAPLRVAGTNQDVTQRKLAEKALIESESRWTSLVDLAPVGITLVGSSGVVQFANRQKALFAEDNVVGRRLAELLPPSLASEVDRVVLEGYQKRVSSQFQSWASAPDGSLRRLENFVAPIIQHQEVSSLMIVSIDVTASELVSARRRRANRRMEILLELHGHAEWAKQQLLDRALDAAVELTESEVGCLSFYSEETQQFTPHPWSKTTDLPAVNPFEDDVIRQRRPIVVNDLPASALPLKRVLAVPVFEGDQIVAVVGVGNKDSPYDGDDTNELSLLADSVWYLQKQRETEESLRRLYQAIEHAPVSVFITDREGRITYSNPKVTALTGYGEKELLGADMGLLHAELMAPEAYQELWKTLRSGRDWQGDLPTRRKDGSAFTELASISAVQDSDGAITHFVAVKEDVTERRATQELLYQAQKMETVGQLAAGVAHDFNNLLTSVLGYNQMLLLKLEPESPLRLYAEKLELSGNRAAALVTGLLAIGRQQRLMPVLSDLNQVLSDEVELLESLVNGVAHLVLRFDSEPVHCVVDPGQIGQAVVNLVSNAKDAVGPGGEIIVSTGRTSEGKGGRAWIRIEDNGPGIAQELREKVFEPFFTTKGIGKGTGLGLSIVRGAIQQMNGTISLERRPQPGASFLITFPLTT